MSVLAFEDYAEGARYDADVIVVGTGAGGAVVGAELAAAGMDVLFVEEGSYHPTTRFTPYLQEAASQLYRDGGATAVIGTPSFTYLEGRCVGGSTVINGGMCYRPPEHVAETWAKITRTDELSMKGLEPYLQRVERMVHAKPQHPASVGGDNDIMRRGAEKMGWKYTHNARNQDACVGANNCVLGCPTGAKQSTLVTYMPRALSAGARCLTEVRVERLLIEGGRCVGVAGRGVDPRTRKLARKVELRAPRVVVACGAVQTPHLLLRHKIARRSGQLGENFLCHPNVKLLAVYPHDVQGWKGVSQGGQVREFHDEGIIFAENMIPSGAVAANTPFVGPASWELIERYNGMVVSGVLVEDSNAGKVSRGPFDMAIVRYDITEYDHERFIKGAKLLGRMHFEMGAEYVILPFVNFHRADSIDDLDRIDPKKHRRKDMELFTPHLMGTARMGASEDDSVVDVRGRVWDLPGCYVADASLFPTAVAVNPQITIMALATRVAEGILNN